MGQNIILFATIKIIIVLVIFSLIALSNSFFLETKHNNEQRSTFECGFKSYKNVNLNLNFNFFFSAILVVLYELEMLFFVPFVFNLNLITHAAAMVFIWLFFTILITFIVDVKFKITNWIL